MVGIRSLNFIYSQFMHKIQNWFDSYSCASLDGPLFGQKDLSLSTLVDDILYSNCEKLLFPA